MAVPEIKFDALLLFAETRGIYLTERQLEYCRRVLHCNDSIKAARDAGFADPEDDGCKMYDAYSEMLEEWRAYKRTDYFNSLNVYRDAQKATVIKKIKVEGGDDIEQTQPSHSTRIHGTKGLCDMLGFNAPTESKVTVTPGEIPESVQEILDRVYKQASSE